jgi:hypothetical protein
LFPVVGVTQFEKVISFMFKRFGADFDLRAFPPETYGCIDFIQHSLLPEPEQFIHKYRKFFDNPSMSNFISAGVSYQFSVTKSKVFRPQKLPSSVTLQRKQSLHLKFDAAGVIGQSQNLLYGLTESHSLLLWIVDWHDADLGDGVYIRLNRKRYPKDDQKRTKN